MPTCLPACLPADIAGMSWSKASRGSVLHVKRSEGPPLSFLGFRDKDVEALRSLTGRQIKDDPLATRWGAWLPGCTRIGGKCAAVCPALPISRGSRGDGRPGCERGAGRGIS